MLIFVLFFIGGPPSAVLLKVELNNIPTKQCNNSYFEKNNPKLKFGIISDMMICAGSVNGGRDTCTVWYLHRFSMDV